jgi:DNA-binding CsgD family transcriptional regulator
MNRPQDTVLTQREREVLVLVARGLTNKEIANELCTSTSAVKIFLHQACEKLGARNRAQAVILAMRRGAIQTEDVYSLEGLADLLASLGAEAIQTIAQLVKQRLEKAPASTRLEAPSPARISKLLSLQK